MMIMRSAVGWPRHSGPKPYLPTCSLLRGSIGDAPANVQTFSLGPGSLAEPPAVALRLPKPIRDGTRHAKAGPLHRIYTTFRITFRGNYRSASLIHAAIPAATSPPTPTTTPLSAPSS